MFAFSLALLLFPAWFGLGQDTKSLRGFEATTVDNGYLVVISFEGTTNCTGTPSSANVFQSGKCVPTNASATSFVKFDYSGQKNQISDVRINQYSDKACRTSSKSAPTINVEVPKSGYCAKDRATTSSAGLGYFHRTSTKVAEVTGFYFPRGIVYRFFNETTTCVGNQGGNFFGGVVYPLDVCLGKTKYTNCTDSSYTTQTYTAVGCTGTAKTATVALGCTVPPAKGFAQSISCYQT